MHRGTTVTASASLSSRTTSSKKISASAERRRRILDRSLARTARDRDVVTGTRTVADPYDPGTFITATVNRRVDILAAERSTGRITEAQFQVGRMIQAVFERGSGARLSSGGWSQGGSRDQTVAHELAIIFAIEDAEKVRKFVRHLEHAIGGVGVRFLRAILAEGFSFSSYAERTGKGSGERAATDIAKRFRWLLEALTEKQHTVRGAVPAPVVDQYSARAAEVEAAQA